jgi:hypothetical protein
MSTDVPSLEALNVSVLFKKTNLILKLSKPEKKFRGKEIFLELSSTKFNHLKENMSYLCPSYPNHVTHSLNISTASCFISLPPPAGYF